MCRRPSWLHHLIDAEQVDLLACVVAAASVGADDGVKPGPRLEERLPGPTLNLDVMEPILGGLNGPDAAGPDSTTGPDSAADPPWSGEPDGAHEADEAD